MTIPEVDNPLGLPEEIRGLKEFGAAFASALTLVELDPAVREAVGKTKVGNPISVEVVPSPDKWARKMIERATAAGQAWVDGVQNPSRDFKSAALAANGKWKGNVTKAVQDDAFAKGMATVNVDQAIATAVRVGATGFTNGIAARTDKITAAVADLQPKVAALKRTIDAMPQDTDGQREARLLAARRGMIAIGRVRKGLSAGGAP